MRKKNNVRREFWIQFTTVARNDPLGRGTPEYKDDRTVSSCIIGVQWPIAAYRVQQQSTVHKKMIFIDIEIKRKHTKALISSTPVLHALWVAVVRAPDYHMIRAIVWQNYRPGPFHLEKSSDDSHWPEGKGETAWEITPNRTSTTTCTIALSSSLFLSFSLFPFL